MSAQTIVRKLSERGFDVYIVGGYVRDGLLGIISNDVDIATNAKPEQIESIFAKEHKVKTVGKSFGVVIVDNIEVATFRKDAYVGLNHKDVTITYANTIEDDLSRRDFTINAMALDVNHNLIDPFGGQNDLIFRLVNFVGNAKDRIREDPNRMLRACRFVAQLNGSLENNTRRAIQKCAGYMQYVAPERIRIEVLKAMKTQRPSKFFDALDECRLLGYVFPSLVNTVSHTGGNYHPETVYDHCMATGDSISCRCPLTRLAGYLHDVGKPVTYNSDTGQFLEHEKAGADLVQDELTTLKFSNDEIRAIVGLIKMHMRTATVLNARGVRRLLRKLQANSVHYRDYLRLFLADRNANTGLPKMSSDDVRNMINVVEDEMSIETGVTSIKDLKVNGYDVMRIKGFPPGPWVGKVLEQLLTVVIEYPSLNNKEILENILKQTRLTARS